MSDNDKKKKLPTPKEIQQEFESFLKQKYGDSVKFSVSSPSVESETSSITPPKNKKRTAADLKFDYKPKEVKQYLDRFVIKQDEGKKALSIGVCDHYNHVKACLDDPKMSDFDYSKQNIIVLGPTGVGKTYMIKHIAKLIGVPFVKADATRFSETGYVGANVDDLIRDLVSQAEGDIELAQYGIVYLDEADKLATPPNIVGRDVSGRGVQFGLLKLMEETEVDLRASGSVSAQLETMMEFQSKGKVDQQMVNTRHILFIISGAFNGLQDIVKKRMNQKNIGFGAEIQVDDADAQYMHYVTSQDFIDFGFEPEFIGRLPIQVVCEELEAKDLYKILCNSEGSIIRQYERAFQAYGINVMFANEALHAISAQAHKQKTGARALMTVCEKILRDYKFELPSVNIDEFVVTVDVVHQPQTELAKILDDPDYNRRLVAVEKVRRYEIAFEQKHNMQISFDDEATSIICQMTGEQTPEEICDQILESYEHGLSLIKQNTGTSRFVLTKQVVQDPDTVLEKWIRESYLAKSKDVDPV